MSAITPQTELRLIKCPLEQDNLNQMNFANANAQYNYFNSLTHLTADRFTYQRKEGIIRYPDHIDNLLGYNYVMYQNEAYTNKWFYAFITNMEYVNDKMTNITIKTDVFQTWQFDLVYKRSFVEREHVNNDSIGLHTIPEKLETGEYICSGKIPLPDTSEPNIVFQVIYDDTFPSLSYQYGGVFSGTCFLIFDIENGIKYIKALDEAGHRDYIVAIFMYKGDIKSSESYTISTASYGTLTYRVVKPTSNSTLENFIILSSKPTSLGSYTPRNKKLLCYPYNYLLADNGVGGVKPYKYEDFGQDGVTFARYSTTTIGGSVYYAPRNYKWTSATESEANLSEGFAGAKFPVCSWTTDSYTNWLTQNSINEKYNAIGRVGQTLAGATMMAAGGATMNPTLFLAGTSMVGQGVGGAIGDISQDLKQREEHSVAPMELSGNASLGDVMYALNRSLPIFYKMNIKEEYAKTIDRYFDLFGYQVNDVKLPNITGRTNWNYVKTVNINLEGDIPEGDLQEIKNIFNNGVTIWHNPSTYLDYSQSNAIV